MPVALTALVGLVGEARPVGHAADHRRAPLAAEAEITATWTRVPLGDWVRSVARLAGRAVVLDRRLDPERPVTRDCRSERLSDVLAGVAMDAEAEVAWLANSIRIVPRGRAEACLRAERCRTAALAALPKSLRGVADSSRGWSWPAGAVPRDLVAAEAATAPCAIEGHEDLPHDHLPAGELPALSLAERLDLLLAHYDRRIEWRPRPGGGLAGRIVSLDSAIDPGPTAITRPTAGRRTTPGKTLYSLRLAAPLETALGAVAARLELTLELDRESLANRGISAAEIVRVEVVDVSRDELLDALVAPVSLHWRIDGRRLVVSARGGESGDSRRDARPEDAAGFQP